MNLPQAEAEAVAPGLREFWAEIAEGDQQFDFPQLPEQARQYFESFGATNGTVDNDGCLTWNISPDLSDKSSPFETSIC